MIWERRIAATKWKKVYPISTMYLIGKHTFWLHFSFKCGKVFTNEYRPLIKLHALAEERCSHHDIISINIKFYNCGPHLFFKLKKNCYNRSSPGKKQCFDYIFSIFDVQLCNFTDVPSGGSTFQKVGCRQGCRGSKG